MARRKAERFPSWATVMEYVDSILEGRKIACPERSRAAILPASFRLTRPAL